MVSPLPYRPLEVRGHGVYDPVRDAFYPFSIAALNTAGNVALLPAKSGSMYYIHWIELWCMNGNDTGGLWPYGRLRGYVSTNPGALQTLVVVWTQPSDGTTKDYSYVDVTPDVLLAPGTGVNVEHGNNMQYGYVVCSYTTIPADEGEV